MSMGVSNAGQANTRAKRGQLRTRRARTARQASRLRPGAMQRVIAQRNALEATVGLLERVLLVRRGHTRQDQGGEAVSHARLTQAAV
jgi:hypothetical protein